MKVYIALNELTTILIIFDPLMSINNNLGYIVKWKKGGKKDARE
jgi:hypothetical protein